MTGEHPAPGDPSGEGAPDTVTEAVALLRDTGFVAEFGVRDGALVCGPCGHRHDPADAVIERIFRFEGASDPDDEAIVLGLRCAACGTAGTLVAAYGPTADPDEVTVLARLRDVRDR